MNDTEIYQKAHTLIDAYGTGEVALHAILKAIVELQKADEDTATIKRWIRIGDAVKELKDLASGETVLH